jgi:hypothetical protein
MLRTIEFINLLNVLWTKPTVNPTRASHWTPIQILCYWPCCAWLASASICTVRANLPCLTLQYGIYIYIANIIYNASMQQSKTRLVCLVNLVAWSWSDLIWSDLILIVCNSGLHDSGDQSETTNELGSSVHITHAIHASFIRSIRRLLENCSVS